MGHWKTRVKILCSKSWEGQNSMKAKIWGSKFYFFLSWNPWSKFYVPWKGGSKFCIFSQCLEKGGSKPRSLPTNFSEGVPHNAGSTRTNFPHVALLVAGARKSHEGTFPWHTRVLLPLLRGDRFLSENPTCLREVSTMKTFWNLSISDVVRWNRQLPMLLLENKLYFPVIHTCKVGHYPRKFTVFPFWFRVWALRKLSTNMNLMRACCQISPFLTVGSVHPVFRLWFPQSEPSDELDDFMRFPYTQA